MTATVKQRVVLGVLGAALAVAVWVQTRPEAPVAASQAARSAGAPRSQRAAEPSEPTAVRLAALAASRSEPTGGSRNPFRFQPKAASVPARAASPKDGLAAPAPVAAPTPPPGPPPPPPIPLKFIGVVERANGVKWAVLSDSRSTMYGREGDIVDGQYLIVKIGLESVELSLADGRGKQTLRLSGQ